MGSRTRSVRQVQVADRHMRHQEKTATGCTRRRWCADCCFHPTELSDVSGIASCGATGDRFAQPDVAELTIELTRLSRKTVR